MEDINIVEAVERYISGTMSPDERMYFEQLRKTNPEVDQMVVEHTFFMQQMNRYDETRRLKSRLETIHLDLAEKGLIRSPKLRGQARVVYLFNRYKRTAAIAASIAGITVLTFSALIWSLSPGKPATTRDLQALSRQINALKTQNQEQNKEIRKVKEAIHTPAIAYKTGGTGFMIDPKGYIVTNAHVIAGASNIAVQRSGGKDLRVDVLHVDTERDIAILKIADTSFQSTGSIPYSIKKGTADMAEQVFTLGYPRNEIVYGDGYLAARTGFNGDTLTCQIAIAANPGNSGGPVLNRNGEVVGILSTKQVSAEGVVFATQSKYIHLLLQQLKERNGEKIKLPAVSALKGMERTQQVKRISEFVYMVKVS